MGLPAQGIGVQQEIRRFLPVPVAQERAPLAQQQSNPVHLVRLFPNRF